MFDRKNIIKLQNDIKNLDLKEDQIVKLLDYLNLVLDDDNQFYDIEYLTSWIDNIRKKSEVLIEMKNINELKGWSTESATGEIVHSSGEFFKIIGIRVNNSTREVSGWDQPMVFQKEMGVLGIIRTKFNGVNHYLLNAKFEPGNTLQYQISPTLQATYSNLKKAHGGKKPKFCEFFLDETQSVVIYKKWLAEDGGRFYQKSNLNMLIDVEFDKLGTIPEDYKWFTLSQVKEFLLKDNYINPHVRSILCHI